MCICSCSEYRIPWELKTRPLLQLQMFARLLQFASPFLFTLSLSLCFFAYKTRHQGQTLELISEASGSLGGDSFRFFWQVITEAVWWKSRRTIVTTFPLSFFFQRLHPVDGNPFCVPPPFCWNSEEILVTHLTPVQLSCTFLTPRSPSMSPNLEPVSCWWNATASTFTQVPWV